MSGDAGRAPRRRGSLVKVGVALAVTVLTLGAAEVALRVQGYEPTSRLRRGRERILRLSSDPDLLYELRPLARGEAWGTDVRVNAAGFRGDDLAPDKGDRWRAAVLGDSVAFGNLIPRGAAFPDVLERLLRRTRPRAQVLNLAVGGYDVLQAARNLEVVGLAYDPDLVVYGYCLNDAGIASPNIEYLEKLEVIQSSAWFRSRLAQLAYATWHRAWTAIRDPNDPDVFRDRYAHRIDPIGADETELRQLMASVEGAADPIAFYGDPAKVGRVRWAFRRLREVADAHGVDVLVVVIPWLEETEGGYPHDPVHRIVAGEARRAGHAVLDVTDVFLREGIESLRRYKRDLCHPSKRGHALLARSIRGWIDREMWAPEPTGR